MSKINKSYKSKKVNRKKILSNYLIILRKILIPILINLIEVFKIHYNISKNKQIIKLILIKISIMTVQCPQQYQFKNQKLRMEYKK